MTSNFHRNIAYTEAIREPFSRSHRYTVTTSTFPQLKDVTQTASVTTNRFLWWQMLTRKIDEDTVTVPQNTLEENIQLTSPSPRNRALIELLRTWREGDEQEQKSTWEYLKQALDEDRLSDRKLFP